MIFFEKSEDKQKYQLKKKTKENESDIQIIKIGYSNNKKVIIKNCVV